MPKPVYTQTYLSFDAEPAKKRVLRCVYHDKRDAEHIQGVATNYGDDQTAWYSMLQNEDREKEWAKILDVLPHFPKPERLAVELMLLKRMSWHEASKVVYPASSNSSGDKLKRKVKVHFERIMRIKEAIKAKDEGADLVQLALILGLDHKGATIKNSVWSHMTKWSKYYGLYCQNRA